MEQKSLTFSPLNLLAILSVCVLKDKEEMSSEKTFPPADISI